MLGNCIPFQISASVFSPVHSAFAIGIAFASQAWRILFPWPLILLKTLQTSLEPGAELSGSEFGPTVYLRGLHSTSPCSVFVRRLKAKPSAVP